MGESICFFHSRSLNNFILFSLLMGCLSRSSVSTLIVWFSRSPNRPDHRLPFTLSIQSDHQVVFSRSIALCIYLFLAVQSCLSNSQSELKTPFSQIVRPLLRLSFLITVSCLSRSSIHLHIILFLADLTAHSWNVTISVWFCLCTDILILSAWMASACIVLLKSYHFILHPKAKW